MLLYLVVRPILSRHTLLTSLYYVILIIFVDIPDDDDESIKTKSDGYDDDFE